MFFTTLPQEIKAYILQFCDAKAQANAASTCKDWRHVISIAQNATVQEAVASATPKTDVFNLQNLIRKNKVLISVILNHSAAQVIATISSDLLKLMIDLAPKSAEQILQNTNAEIIAKINKYVLKKIIEKQPVLSEAIINHTDPHIINLIDNSVLTDLLKKQPDLREKLVSHPNPVLQEKFKQFSANPRRISSRNNPVGSPSPTRAFRP